MIDAFVRPVNALLKARKEMSLGTTFIVLVVSAVLLAVAEIIAVRAFAWKISLAILVGTVVVVVLGAVFLKIALSILGAKYSGVFESLSAVTYGLAPLASALFVASLLILIPGKTGFILASLAIMVGTVAMAAASIRAIKELAGTDLLMAVVAYWIVLGVGMSVGYMITMIGYMYARMMPMMALA